MTISDHPAARTTDRESLSDLVEAAAVALESLLIQARSTIGLGTHERMAMSQLRLYGPMPISQLAARLGLSRAALTSLIDRLVQKGWVRRCVDSIDRRQTLVELTGETSAMLADTKRPFQRDIAAMEAPLSDTELKAVAAFLRQLTLLCEAHVGHYLTGVRPA